MTRPGVAPYYSGRMGADPRHVLRRLSDAYVRNVCNVRDQPGDYIPDESDPLGPTNPTTVADEELRYTYARAYTRNGYALTATTSCIYILDMTEQRMQINSLGRIGALPTPGYYLTHGCIQLQGGISGAELYQRAQLYRLQVFISRSRLGH